MKVGSGFLKTAEGLSMHRAVTTTMDIESDSNSNMNIYIES